MQYEYTFTKGERKIVQKSYNLLSAAEKAGLGVCNIEKLGIKYLQKTPFDQRVRNIECIEYGQGMERSTWKVAQKKLP